MPPNDLIVTGQNAPDVNEPVSTDPAAGKTVLENFVDTLSRGNPEEITNERDRYNITIPLEFENLGKATSQMRNLIFTYDLYKSGQISLEDYDDYIDTVWLKKKAQQDFNEMDTSKLFKAANGDTVYFVKKGPDAGKFYSPAKGISIDEASNPEFFPIQQTSVGTGEQAANTEYLKVGAKKAAEYSDTIATQVSAAFNMKRDMQQAIQILEAYPRVAGVFNVDEKNDSILDAMVKSIFTLMRDGANIVWGTISADLTGFWQNLLLNTTEKEQLAKLEGLFSKLGTAARSELAGQGTITDAEAEAVAKQFGSLNDGASAVIAGLRLALWRSEMTILQAEEWTRYEQEALGRDAAPLVNKFLTTVWKPIINREIDKIDVVALGSINAVNPNQEGEAATPETTNDSLSGRNKPRAPRNKSKGGLIVAGREKV